jgi:hypothetical protein
MVALMVGIFAIVSPASAQVICNTYTYTGDDDSAYAANLPFTLTLGSTEYNNVYVSTNGTMTFGQPDGNYSNYPQTPSVSVAGYDWVSFGEGAYLSFGSTENTFCAEWSVRPYPQFTGELTQIRLVIDRASDGGWHGEIVTFGWLPNNLRRGIRFEQGQDVVQIEAAFDVNGGVPIEVSPAPTPSSFTQEPETPTPTPVPTDTPTPESTPTPIETPTETPTPEPTLEPTPSPEPTILPTPIEIPSPTPSLEPTLEPTLTPTPTPTPSPSESVIEPPVPMPSQETTLEPVFTPEPTLEPEPTPSPSESVQEPVQEPATAQEVTQEVIDNALADGVLTDTERELVADALIEEFAGEPISFEAFVKSGLDYEDLPPSTPITLENGVVITAEIADAIEIFDTPGELLTTIFSDPGKALKALTNVGADMTPEQRETSQNTVVAAVIVTQVAQVRRIK